MQFKREKYVKKIRKWETLFHNVVDFSLFMGFTNKTIEVA